MNDRSVRLGMIQLDLLRFSTGTLDASVTVYLPHRAMISVDLGNPCQKLRLALTLLFKKLWYVKIKGW